MSRRGVRTVVWVVMVATVASGFVTTVPFRDLSPRRVPGTKVIGVSKGLSGRRTSHGDLRINHRTLHQARAKIPRALGIACANKESADDNTEKDENEGGDDSNDATAAAEAAADAAFAAAEDNIARAEKTTAAVSLVAATDDDPFAGLGPFGKAKARFLADPKEHLLIPVIAACVGWITNKLAVEMIFYPLYWKGIPIKRFPGSPFGLVGWQGIVPAKAAMMSARIVDMVTTKLINVQEVFYQLNPSTIAQLMTPEVDAMASGIASEALPPSLARVARTMVKGLPAEQLRQLREIQKVMLEGLTKDLQRQLPRVLDVKRLVVEELSTDKRVLVGLFKKVGEKELSFLVNSGWYFGFGLGLLQMVAWMFCRAWWTLPLGGMIVGLATNWIALKFIFEPVDPIKMFGITFQGLFLKRQPEVSAEFANYMGDMVLTSQKLWDTILHGPHSANFNAILDVRVRRAITSACAVLGLDRDAVPMDGVCSAVRRRLPNHVGALHEYTDKTLALKPLMTRQMGKLSAREFEGVLHPIFQEDEITLIIAGGFLGLLAGAYQAWLSIRAERKRRLERRAAAAIQAPPPPIARDDDGDWW